MADAIVTPKPVPEPRASDPPNAREFFAGLILNAIMIQPRANTPEEAMAAAWEYADKFQYMGVWGPGAKKEENDG